MLRTTALLIVKLLVGIVMKVEVTEENFSGVPILPIDLLNETIQENENMNIVAELVTSDLDYKPKSDIPLPDLLELNSIKEPPLAVKELVSKVEMSMEYNETPLAIQSTPIEPHYPVRSKVSFPNDCAKCDFSSESVYKLRDHYNQIHSEEMFLCDECGRIFHYKGNLKDHKRFYHSDSSETFACPQCDFTSNDKKVLSRHLRITHYNTETLNCKECDFTTSYKKSMTSHQLSKHSKKAFDRFSCNICNKRFAYENSLERHKRVHTNERPFSCDSCQYKAFRLSTLRLHIERNHTNARPFQCRNCKLKFAEEKSLKEHLVAHMRQCSTCTYKTTNKGDLKKHQKQCKS